MIRGREKNSNIQELFIGFNRAGGMREVIAY